MTTKIIFVNNMFPEQKKIQEAVDILRKGGIVGMPTETVFGLACNGQNEKAVCRLYSIKNRALDKQLVIQVADYRKLFDYKARITPEIESVLKRFWPGPLTVILNTKNGKTGFRIPDNNAALSIIKKADFPLAVTSANISGDSDLLCADDVKTVFDGKIGAVVDDGTNAAGGASTVVDCTQSPFKILRKGLMAEEIRDFCHIKDGAV
jgi:L-threonylcarbamoyladenylate synthase